MKGIKIIALTSRGEEAIKKHLKEKQSFQTKLIFKRFFVTSFDGKRIFILRLKSAKLNTLVNPSDLGYSIIKSFVDDGYLESDFNIEELEA
jgi:hypothetical protein